MAQKQTRGSGLLAQFLPLYIVLVLQNVVTLSVNLADNIMLGAYSEAALSGVAAVNQIQFVYQQLLTAFGDGLVIIASQYWGKRRTQPMRTLSGIAMRAGLCVCLVLFAVVSLLPRQCVGLFTTDEVIIGEGADYLDLIRFTYLFFAVTQLSLAVLRSMEIVRIAFVLSVMTLFVNCGINWLLIFGHLGFPELGARGAAVGTLCARMLESAVVLVYLGRKGRRIGLRLSDYLPAGFFGQKSKSDTAIQAACSGAADNEAPLPVSLLRKDYFRVCIPMLAASAMWGLNTAMQTVILGHMTSAAIAANSAASTLFLMVKSTAIGAAAATSIIIGKTIGTGDLEMVRLYSGRLQRLFVVIGILSGLFLFFLRIPVLGLYDLSPEAMRLANQFLLILCFVEVGMSYQMPTNSGIIRGAGNAMYMLKLDFISIWCIVIPLSAIMAFVVKASPAVVVICLNADQFFKGIPAYWVSHHGDWIRKLTR